MIADRSGLELVTESMRPLHTGDFGGLWVKLIWFFFGLVLSMMVLSGLLNFWCEGGIDGGGVGAESLEIVQVRMLLLEPHNQRDPAAGQCADVIAQQGVKRVND